MDTEDPETSEMNKCIVELKLDQECHKTTYCRKSGLSAVAALEKDSQQLLSQRTYITFGDEYICEHHLTHYQNQQTFYLKIPEISDYKVFTQDKRDCMLHYCDHCPRKDGLKYYLTEQLSPNKMIQMTPCASSSGYTQTKLL